MQFVKPLPFDEAVDKIGRKSLIGSLLSSNEWADVPAALRERAFFSSRVESLRFLQRARDGIADFLQSNSNEAGALKTGSRADFVKQMQDFLRGEGVDRTDGGLKDLAGEKRLGLIFDTQTRQANEYGYWREGQDADVLDAFPAQRFIRTAEVKDPRSSHAQYEGQVFLKTDPIWANVINEDFGVPWPPFAFGCQHDVEDVSREEAEALGLLPPGQAVRPDKKNFNENLKASTRGLDPDLLAKLMDDFLGKLVYNATEGTIQWATLATASFRNRNSKPLRAGEIISIMVLPGGSHKITPSIGGNARKVTVLVDANSATELNKQLGILNTQRGNNRAFFDFDHNGKDASGWPIEYFWRDDPAGVYAKVQLSEAGAAAIEGKNYRSFSIAASILRGDPARIVASGTVSGLSMGGFVNDPAFPTILPLWESDEPCDTIAWKKGKATT